MARKEQVTDSPTGWIAKHIQEYVESGGEKGHLRNGVPHLLLTTRGRKSGKLRRTALIYGKDGDNYVLIPSNGGAQHHPSWYLNLVANPQVEVQVLGDKFEATARTATEAEKPALWKLMAQIFPNYDEYQTRTKREIPVVVVEPIQGAAGRNGR